MSQQLVKKGVSGKHENVMPKSWIEAIKDKYTGQSLLEILQGFNMCFLSYTGNKENTRLQVPMNLRKRGLWVVYEDYNNEVIVEWYDKKSIEDEIWKLDSSWNKVPLISDIRFKVEDNILYASYNKGKDWEYIGILSSIYPDEEDITLVHNEDKIALKLKNRDTTKGKGYIILRTEKPLAEQMTKENTIYEVRYDFDLGGKTLEVPANCVLDFKGGSFSNGTIKGNNTAIEAGINKIFNYNINITGTWNVECGYCEWFGYNNDGNHDSYDYINKAFSLNQYVRLLNKTYPISHKLVLSDYNKLIGYQGDATKIVPFGEFTDDCLISITSHNGYSKHGFLKDVGIYNSPTNGIICNGITQGFNIENVDIKYCNESGLVITKCWYAAFRNINIWYNKIGISLVNKPIVENGGAVNGISFYNVWANHNSQHAVYINTHTNAINFNSCTFENCTDVAFLVENIYTNVSLLNCYFETNNTLFNVNSSYKIGNFSLISCYGVSHGAGYLGEIGDLNSFVMLDTSLYYGDAVTPEVSHCIKSNAAKNLLSGQIATKIPYIDTAGKVLDLLGSKNDWNQNYESCDSPTWQTNVLNITHRGNYQWGCSAKDSLGFNRLSDSNSNYGIYRVERVLAEPDEEYRLNIIRNNKGTEEEVNCYKIDRYGNITFNSITTNNIVLPHQQGFPSTNTGIRNGTTFFELDAKKMATYYGGKWYWMDGTIAKSY